jgi:hypothetical protein
MLFAFAYAVVRLLLDAFDVRLRVGDPRPSYYSCATSCV